MFFSCCIFEFKIISFAKIIIWLNSGSVFVVFNTYLCDKYKKSSYNMEKSIICSLVFGN